MTDNQLAHYGVLGMHWGKRAGGKPNRSATLRNVDDARVALKTAEKNRHDKVKAKTSEIKASLPKVKRLTYGKNTQRRAAQYVINHDMPVKEALTKAHAEIIRNTAIAYVAVYATQKIVKNYTG